MLWLNPVLLLASLFEALLERMTRPSEQRSGAPRAADVLPFVRRRRATPAGGGARRASGPRTAHMSHASLDGTRRRRPSARTV